jgi:hypothetical protein
MSEKQELAPPAYAEIVVTEEALEALEKKAECPTWIRRLPLTLPITHALLSVPTALFLARSLSEAVLIAAFYSFVLFSATTAGIARSLRRNEPARAQAARSLAVAGTTTILWPLMALVVLSPSMHHRRGCAMMNRLRSHHHMRPRPAINSMPGHRPFHIVNDHPILAATPVDETPSATVLRGGANGSPAAVVFSSKGSRVLIGSGPESVGQLTAAVAALTASAEQAKDVVDQIDHFVVSSKGIKVLTDDDDEIQVQIEEFEMNPAVSTSLDEQL